jgi:hypothetical protein
MALQIKLCYSITIGFDGETLTKDNFSVIFAMYLSMGVMQND